MGNNTYLIVNLNNPTTGGKSGAGSHAIGGGTKINYLTQHNYFARGRTDAAGSSKIVGELWADDNNIYTPSNVITRDRGYYYQGPEGYMMENEYAYEGLPNLTATNPWDRRHERVTTNERKELGVNTTNTTEYIPSPAHLPIPSPGTRWP